MKNTPVAYVLGLAAMVGCCIGLPLLATSLSSAAIIAWLTDNAILGVLLVTAAAAAALYHQDRRRRRATRAAARTTTPRDL